MSDIHALSGAYAVDALDDIERAQFEQHLAACAECRAEVASFRETAALLAETEADGRRPSLRARCSPASPGPPLPPEAPDAGADDRGPREPPCGVAGCRTCSLAAAAVVAARPSACSPGTPGSTTTTSDLAAAGPERTGRRHGSPSSCPAAAAGSPWCAPPSLRRAVMIGDHVPAAAGRARSTSSGSSSPARRWSRPA